MRTVADASAAVAYLMGRASDAERHAMLGDVHAPSLFDVEVTNALRGLLRGGEIHRVTAELGREELAQLGVRRHPDVELLPRAWELRDVCTMYDGLYVALAERLDAMLVTRDLKLARAAERFVAVSTS